MNQSIDVCMTLEPGLRIGKDADNYSVRIDHPRRTARVLQGGG